MEKLTAYQAWKKKQRENLTNEQFKILLINNGIINISNMKKSTRKQKCDHIFSTALAETKYAHSYCVKCQRLRVNIKEEQKREAENFPSINL